MTNTNYLSINWEEAKQMVEQGKLKAIGSNLSQINNQGEYSISTDRTKLYKRRHSAAKVVFDLIAKG